jgi:ABC-type siderophore export system fused ATPase/permease subunit
MTKFKFFRGYVGTLDLMDGQTYATASIFDPVTYWTSEEIERERIERMERARYVESPTYGSHMEMIRLDRHMEQMRNHGRLSHEQYMLNRDMLIEQERIRRLETINHSRETDNQIRLYQATRVTTVNPKWWMKIKIVLQESWLYDPIGVVVMTLLTSLVTFIGIAKLFGV